MGRINLEAINFRRLLLRIPRIIKRTFKKYTRTPHKRFHRFYQRSSAAFAQNDVSPPADDIWLSIITPVFNAPPRHLAQLVQSFVGQTIAGVELILLDDASNDEDTIFELKKFDEHPNVRVFFNSVNGGISATTNAGLAVASGKWVAFLDHDDLIAPNGLRAIYESLQQNENCQFLYTDELIVNDKLRIISWFLKPAYDPVLLSGVNYINHFSVFKRQRLEELGGLRSEFDGSQDYDLVLRYLKGVNDQDVLHLPYPAYWWRVTGESYSRNYLDKALANARKALLQHGGREGWEHTVKPSLNEELHRVNYTPKRDGWPKIGVVIPNRDKPELISQVLSDLFEKTDYPSLEVLVVDNGTTDTKTLDVYSEYAERFDNFRYEIEPEKFNFSRMTNRGLRGVDADHYLLLNNDIEVIDGGWLKEMVSCLAYEKVGIVGAKLLYGNDTIQHAGVIVGLGGLAGHWYYKQRPDVAGPMGRLRVRNSFSCVTGAVMLVSKECLEEVGLLNEEAFAIAYNDVDFCMRALKAGFRTVWTPFACLYHHESVSRGSDESSINRKRFEREQQSLQAHHGTKSFVDPAYNPLFSRYNSQAELDFPRSPKKARRWFER